MQPLEQEWKKLARAEARLLAQRPRVTPKAGLEEKIPKKLSQGLESAFAKAFTLLFEKGTGVIEKTYRRESIQQAFRIRDFAVDVTQGRRALRRMRQSAGRSKALTTTVTAVEGLGLGILGIGLPDIAVWLSILLRSIYETALQYGFAYDTPRERLFVLKMMEASMRTGEARLAIDREVEQLIRAAGEEPSEEALRQQIQRTSQAFAADMLPAKFVQGLPVVGILGGAANPLYYRRVMDYVELKYRKRYLLRKL